ncbi:hypothetical protein [Virgibacillus alimentarius]|uniref:hypothetical protein n=1 Tax=Virgibacillus alimentarius TaxID=698769 RepID=UPI00049313F4|nr:hypothetical protein [Virgibacillus alimentarius]
MMDNKRNSDWISLKAKKSDRVVIKISEYYKQQQRQKEQFTQRLADVFIDSLDSINNKEID